MARQWRQRRVARRRSWTRRAAQACDAVAIAALLIEGVADGASVAPAARRPDGGAGRDAPPRPVRLWRSLRC